MVRLNLGALLHLLRKILMMSQRMMRLGDADLRVRSPVLFAAIHKGGDSCQIRLKGEQLQIVEQPHVRFEVAWNAYRAFHVRDAVISCAALFFSLLDTSLHIAK